jgi:cysteinyl-tRNA synthetase
MRLSLALALLLAQTVSGFTVAPRVAASALTTTRTTTTLLEKDEIDDWYADFDPSAFEEPPARAPRSSNNFVGEGTPHDYQRDTSDSSNVNMDVVDRMMSQRLTARKTGQFEAADAIRDELLRDHGVMIRDKERTWRSGCSESGSGRNFGRGGGGRGGDRDGGRGGGRGGRGGGRNKNFGPNGHDYNLSQEAGASVSVLPEPEIHRLMAERLQCKLSRDFQGADSIQEELFSAGVMVHDARKEWRADGQGFGNDDNYSKPGRDRGSRADRNRPYEMSPESDEASDVDAIQKLINERVQAKMERIYGLADDIRDELRDVHNVLVDDKLRMWSVGGDFGAPANSNSRAPGPYMMSPASEVPEDADEVQRTVESRDQARADRNFSLADDIREELKERNIEIDDRTREWAVGGSFTNRPMGGGGPPGTFVRVGGGNLSEEDVELIESLLVERDGYKRDRDFGKADRIRDRLSDDFAVRVDDRSKEWHVVSNEYTASRGSAPLDEATEKYIVDQVNKRAVAKLNRDYEVADAIRDELMDDYQVSVDDRVKEWTALAAVGDPEPGSDDVEDDVDVEIEGAVDDEDDDDEGFPAVPATNGANGTEDLKSLTVVDLKERLRAAGLPVSGKKGELIERLVNQ